MHPLELLCGGLLLVIGIHEVFRHDDLPSQKGFMMFPLLSYMQRYAMRYIARLLVRRGVRRLFSFRGLYDVVFYTSVIIVVGFCLVAFAIMFLGGIYPEWPSLLHLQPMYLDLRLGTRLRY